MTTAGSLTLAVDDTIHTEPRMMSREQMRWYCDALETVVAGTGEFIIAGPTIHSDDEFAAANGLPGIIADGMISTNWISALLFDNFGDAYLETGELQTKFIRPVFEDEYIEAHGKVTGVDETDTGTRYSLDVWCQTSTGELCTVGTAAVTVPAAAQG
jgi:hypothetical protein